MLVGLLRTLLAAREDESKECCCTRRMRPAFSSCNASSCACMSRSWPLTPSPTAPFAASMASVPPAPVAEAAAVGAPVGPVAVIAAAVVAAEVAAVTTIVEDAVAPLITPPELRLIASNA